MADELGLDNGDGNGEGEDDEVLGAAADLSGEAEAERQAVMLLYQRKRISRTQRDATIMRIVRDEQRRASLRPPLSAVQYELALNELDDDMTMAEWRRSTVVQALYYMARGEKRGHNAIKAHLQRGFERAGAEELPDVGPRGGVTRQRAKTTDPKVLENRRAALAKAREALAQKREAGKGRGPGRPRRQPVAAQG